MTAPAEARGARWIFLTDLDRTATARRTAASRYGWRLVAANNRPLGRGVMVAGTLDRCVLDARQVHRAAHDERLAVTLVPVPGGNAWLWRAVLDGAAAAVSTHTFVRRVECARALAQFIAAAARVEPQADLVRHYGAQALRGYEI